MKRILITGANSYIGTSFENWMKQYDGYEIDTVDTMNNAWKNADFSKYDTVFHVAGIAHIKETKKNAHLYYEVNRDLPVGVAQMAKVAGVKQFVFLSSMSVYGKTTGVITKNTVPKPKTNYGKSKFQAEKEILKLKSDDFNVAILRPPMVYGYGCKGNFNSVIKLVKAFPVFPKVNNMRSMIYVDNLSNFVKVCIEKNLNGVFFPQNKDYMNTSQMAVILAQRFNKKLYLSTILGIGVNILKPFMPILKKSFGNLIYQIDDVEFPYCVSANENSLEKSV